MKLYTKYDNYGAKVVLLINLTKFFTKNFQKFDQFLSFWKQIIPKLFHL